MASPECFVADEGSGMRRGSSILVAKMVKKQMGLLDQKRRANRTNFSTLSEIHEEEDGSQNSDGSFFDIVNHLNKTQKDRVDKARRHSVVATGSCFLRCPSQEPSLDNNKRIELYKEFVYAIMHRFGKKRHGDGVLTDGEIYMYGREVFSIDDTEHKHIYNELKILKPPKCLINVQVIAASGLDPMDANGFSDPYCMICLINAGEMQNDGKKKKLLRDIMKGDEVSLTKVMKKTLDPVWNSSFKIEVNDLQNQVLRIDIWDKDDNSVVLDAENSITAIKDFRGAGRMFKEIYQSAKTSKDGMKDDFMGLVEVPLKTIAEHGVDTWHQLESGNRKLKVHGKLHLKLSFEAVASDKSTTRVSLGKPHQIYKDFLTFFSHYDMANRNRDLDLNNNVYDDFNSVQSWDCKLCHPAEIALSQFVIQHQINPLSVSVLKWQVYSNLYICTGIPLEVLVKILEAYKQHSVSYAENLIEDRVKFLKSLDEFTKYAMQLLEKYRHIFDVEEKQRCMELGRLLMCLLMIYKLPLYRKQFPEKSLNREIENIIVKSTNDWFNQIQASFEALENTTLSRLGGMVSLTNAINADLEAGTKSYEPVFNLIKVKYTHLLFGVIELELSEIIKQGTNNLKEELKKIQDVHEDVLGTKMFELYIGVRDLCHLKLALPEVDRIPEGISPFRTWFKAGVIRWIKLAGVKAKNRINKAVELDEVQVIDDTVKHSTSAVDVTCCLAQICTFWKSLEWTDSNDSFMFLTQITEMVGECGMHYSNIIFHQLEGEGFYDDVGQFDVTDQLCIMMNNISHVLQFITGTSKALEFDQVVRTIARLHDETQAEISKNTLERITTSAMEDLVNKIEKILEHIGKRMNVTIRTHMLKIIKDEGASFDTICDPLLQYIDSNLMTLNNGLLTQVFERVLVHFWEDFVECAINVAEKNRERLSPLRYTTLANLVEDVKKFFHGEGGGLSLDAIQSDAYQRLQYILDLNTSTTAQLIERFYCERCAGLTVVGGSVLGSLSCKIFYCSTTMKLNINILNCRDLVPLDTSGSSDPYISVKLKPDHLFSDVKGQKTEHKKNTLYPLFDETIQFDVTAADCARKGATLVFTLFDYDMMRLDDMGGEIHYDLQTVRGLNCVIQGAFTNIPQTELPWCIGAVTGETFDSIASRQHQRVCDQMACDFIAKQKDRHRQMMENNELAKDRPRKK